MIGSKSKTRTYIVRKDNNEKLVFQFNPTSIPYGRGANYASIESAGMAYPLTQFVGGKAREFSVELLYYDKTGQGLIQEAREFLEDLLPPERNSKDFIKPPVFTLAYGYFVKDCVLLGLDVLDIEMNQEGEATVTKFTLLLRQV